MPLNNFFQKLANQIINPFIAIFVGVALLYFIWGVIELIAQSGNEEARTTGKKHMIWGIIGMAVMAGAWGLVNILLQTFGVGNVNIPSGPQGY